MQSSRLTFQRRVETDIIYHTDKSHHGVQCGVVDEGTGVKGALGCNLNQSQSISNLGCNLKEARDGDRLGSHQTLKLRRIGTKFGKEGFRADKIGLRQLFRLIFEAKWLN